MARKLDPLPDSRMPRFFSFSIGIMLSSLPMRDNTRDNKGRANRSLLVSVMAKAGFRNYAQEWWHFSLVAMPADAAYHDFAIRDR